MKAMIAKVPFGIFAFDEKGNLIAKSVFSKDPKIALDMFNEKTPKDVLNKLSRYEIRTKSAEADELLRAKFREYGNELFGSDEELNKFLSAFGMAITRSRMKKAIGRDKFLVQSVNALEDMNRTISLFTDRIHEWYGLHYPELKLSDTELIKNISELGSRNNFPNFRSSTGVELTQEDEEILMKYASFVLSAIQQKKELERYIKEAMTEIAPNFSSLIDPVLASRLLAMAGSMEKLSRMTASTIQLLGAEKALFRHLKQRGKPPKFGLIFHSSYIQNAPDEKKGKVARILASKLMLASRLDYYSKKDESEKLKRDMEEEIRKATE